MSRPTLEVADLVRSGGTAFIGRSRAWIRWTYIKVVLAIARCRTAALGGHIDKCIRCGHRATISYNSCRNRHCPKCQTGARERWIQARRRELLPSPYVHVVFTLPPQLALLALQNKKLIYGLLLRASAETLLQVARNPRHLGGRDRLLQRAPHLEPETPDEPSLMMPGIIISFVFNKQAWLVFRTTPLQNQLACADEPFDNTANWLIVQICTTNPPGRSRSDLLTRQQACLH